MACYEDVVDINDKVKCVLCDIYLPEDNNHIDNHIHGDKHIELYIKRLMIRDNLAMEQGKARCLTCNTDVTNLEHHIKSTQHQQKMSTIRDMLETDGAFLELPTKLTHKSSSVHCTICNCYIEFSMIGINDHLQSQKHRRARAMAVQPFNGIFSVEGTDDDLWCKICQIYFENYIETIFEHVDRDERHVQALNKILRLIEGQNIMIDKFLTDPTEDKASCIKCGIKVPCNIDNLGSHVKGKKHLSA